MAALVRQALSQQRFDLILASEIGPGTCVSRYVREVDSIPRVVEDLELSMIWSKVEAQRTILGRLRHRLTWWKLRRYAAELLCQVDGCTVASEREREVVLNVVPNYHPLTVVPNGVDVERYTDGFGSVEPDTLVFPGALTYRANFDAMAFFLAEVFPRVKAQRPTVRLYITGRTDGVPVDRLPVCDGVVFTDYLDDIRPRIAQSQVCVVPMTTGGGTRLKILEAMALNTPVVATTKGAEGLDVTSGKDILIADESQALANAVLQLLDDAGLRNRLSENGRRLVREKYDWQAIGERLNIFLEQVVAERDRCLVQ
jgi:glycosyltransferase involved in cell wall biosynthesis